MKTKEQLAYEHATYLVPIYETGGACIGQEPEVDQDKHASFLAGYEAGVEARGELQIQIAELGEWSKRELDWRDNAIKDLQGRIDAYEMALKEIRDWKGCANCEAVDAATTVLLPKIDKSGKGG